MSVSDRLARLEARIVWLEKRAKVSPGASDRVALDAAKAALRPHTHDALRKRAPELRPDAARVVAKARAAFDKLDAALAKCAARDALKYTPPPHRGAQ